jgi:hypothetical protein
MLHSVQSKVDSVERPRVREAPDANEAFSEERTGQLSRLRGGSTSLVKLDNWFGAQWEIQTIYAAHQFPLSLSGPAPLAV